MGCLVTHAQRILRITRPRSQQHKLSYKLAVMPVGKKKQAFDKNIQFHSLKKTYKKTELKMTVEKNTTGRNTWRCTSETEEQVKKVQ